MIIDYEAVGLRIRAARKKAGITREALANDADVSLRFISYIEKGQTKMSLETLVSIANALSVTTDDLLCDNLVHAFHVYNKEAQEVFDKCAKRNAPVLVGILKAANDVLEKDDRFQERLKSKKEN
ncbi:MAG: helix-turn-helix transcriptional regulator [Peptococcaceae bacterium]|jgi:transcriptional regulator with XRE-family HTH domain|nr:helix-turn-helix transcriptional regulator [Peptococcaceae bacterium]